ncbi:hypothetical protein SLA2020_178990 [Shorea laevis]
MATATFHQSIGATQLPACGNHNGSVTNYGSSALRFISKGFAVEIRLLRKGNCISRQSKLHLIHASSSHASVEGSVSFISDDANDQEKRILVESALILIRHGESLFNEKNLFTGCVDVPLTKKGVEEAIEAGRRISNIPVDEIYSSSLIRAQMTAMLAMTQH